MPLALVQLLDADFLAIKDWKKHIHTARQLEESAGKLRTEPFKTQLADMANKFIDSVETGYSADVWTVFFRCHVPLLCAIIVKLLDLLLGSLRWKHVATFYVLMFSSPIKRRQRPAIPAIIVATILVMPAAVSGSLTRVGAAFFFLDTILSPLVLYIWETISDRIEVRWMLIGLLLDLIYLSTAVTLSWIHSFGFIAISQTILVGAGVSGMIYLVMTLIFDSGPWDEYFKIVLVGDSGRSVPHPFLRVIEAMAQYIVQRSLFRLNRIARIIISIFVHVELSQNASNSSKQAKPYKYEEIKVQRTVRLLRIKKGWPSQEIECEFEDFHLRTSKSYEAISYVWGTSPDTKLILLDGDHLIVTKSAYEIIHRHRSAWMDKLIWIDQVCINQKDDAEKASQVKLMADIYKNATRVTAFLGQAIFFGNEWFRRVWIIQEAAFAKELHLFYGNICMDWEYVSRAIAVISDRHLLEAILPFGDSDSCCSSSLRDVLIGFANVDTMLEFRGDVNYKRKFDLAMVLKTCSRFIATNPRDKVYAVLGLTTDGSRTMIEPNYDKTYDTRLVYVNAMLVILERGARPLDALTGAGIGFERDVEGLQSWVPDWSHHIQIQIVDNMYTSGTRYEPTIRIVQGPNTMLALEGLQFDKVAYLGGTREVNTKMTMVENISYTQQWFSAAEGLAATHAKDPYHNGQTRIEAFIRTMIGDVISYEEEKKPSTEQCWSNHKALNGFFLTSQYLQIAKTLLAYPIGEDLLSNEFLEQTQDENEKASRFLYFAGVTSCFRRFCVTEEGRMAIVPPLTLPGDIICIIKGTRMPFVLRKSRREDLLVYQLVGCCYVHGVMDGEQKITKAETFTLS